VGGIDRVAEQYDHVSAFYGLPLALHHDLVVRRGDLDRVLELHDRLGVEVLADRDAFEGAGAFASAVGTAAVGGPGAALRSGVVAAGGQAEGSGRGEGGGQQGAATDQRGGLSDRVPRGRGAGT